MSLTTLEIFETINEKKKRVILSKRTNNESKFIVCIKQMVQKKPMLQFHAWNERQCLQKWTVTMLLSGLHLWTGHAHIFE